MTWVEPVQVHFSYDGQNRKRVRFGNGRHGYHNVTINGVECDLGGFAWVHEYGAWKRDWSSLRRAGSLSDASEAAHAKLYEAFEPMVPRLAEVHAEAFEVNQRGKAGEHADMAEGAAERLEAAGKAQRLRSEISDWVASGVAVLRPVEGVRVHVADVLKLGTYLATDRIHDYTRVAEIVMLEGGGRIGWAVVARRSAYSAEVFYFPEHLVQDR